MTHSLDLRCGGRTVARYLQRPDLPARFSPAPTCTPSPPSAAHPSPRNCPTTTRTTSAPASPCPTWQG